MNIHTEEKRKGEMGDGVDSEKALFETWKGKGILWHRLYALTVLVGVCMVWVYRATHIPQKGRWIWIGLFAAELWFGFYWFLTQSVRWNPTYRRTFKQRLENRQKGNFPGVDIFVCTADPKIEPPVMVINTVLSVMAYDYPTDKLSIYLSDDGCSELTFYALLEASRFAKSWLPFCRKFNVEPRSPAAYFSATLVGPKDGLEAVDWLAVKSLYRDMENRINAVTKLGHVPEEIRNQHKGFDEWQSDITSRDHQSILEILIDGRDEKAIGEDGLALPTLVYLSREKRPSHHHNFKAGAMNSLIRASSEISNGAIILNLDCDMYSNNSETVKDVMCFFMDEEKGHEIAYVQLPQVYDNITKNDLYGNSMKIIEEVDFHGLDGLGGPLYIGSGCFHRRESLYGRKYDATCKAEMKIGVKNTQDDVSVLEKKAKTIIACSNEDNTDWGKEIGLKYGCPVEDVITGLSIQCKGWKSIYFTPSRKGFLGVAPLTLAQTLVQQKRWSEGNFQIYLSKYSPLIYGYGKISIGLQMAYSQYGLWAPCFFPTFYHVIALPICLINDISLYPKVNNIWFIPFGYVIIVSTTYNLVEILSSGYSLKGCLNERRIWLYKRLASYPFAFFDTMLKLMGINKSTFIVTSKVVDEDVLKRYEHEIMEFGSNSHMFTIIGTVAVLGALCLISGLLKIVIHEGIELINRMLVQFVVCAVIVLINLPVYQAMFIRSDSGRMPTVVTLKSFALASLAFVHLSYSEFYA